MYFEYRSIENLNDSIIKNLYKFPHDIDYVVGIPRSGMLPANLIALYLNKPFTDLDSFIEGRLYSSGHRGRFIENNQYNRVLIVDDTIGSGHSMSEVKNKLSHQESKKQLLYAAVYGTTIGSKMIDVVCEIIDFPRVFQWNIFHNEEFLSKACCDIDGVLCQNPPIDDDGPIYLDYIKNAPPYFIPTTEIDTLVSCRLEKYRTATEMWLADNHVKYKKLVMLPFKTKEERIRWGKHGEYKGEVFKKSKNVLFIESSFSEAVDIAKTSGKQVFCIENFQMIYPNKEYNKIKQKYITKLKVLIINCLSKIGVDYHVFKKKSV